MDGKVDRLAILFEYLVRVHKLDPKSPYSLGELMVDIGHLQDTGWNIDQVFKEELGAIPTEVYDKDLVIKGLKKNGEEDAPETDFMHFIDPRLG